MSPHDLESWQDKISSNLPPKSFIPQGGITSDVVALDPDLIIINGTLAT